MSSAPDRIGQQELRYFGKVTASISHELKNVLAILNEHAGLLQDFVAMAEQGQPLDVERIRRLSATMIGQIGRGDMIVKRMNRFAHSVDQELANVDLVALVTMVVELFARTASTRGVTVEVEHASDTLNLTTQPFVLETLLGSLLDGLTSAVPGIATVCIELHWQADAVQIRMPGLAVHAEVLAGLLASEQLSSLLAALQARAGFDRESGELYITLPGS